MDVNNDGFFENEPVQNQLMALIDENQRLRAEIKFNTTSPQRTWVGLTDEEVTTCHSLAVLSKKHDGTDPSFTTLLHRQIEAKLKDKNYGS